MSVTYHFTDASETVIVASDGRSIPCDPANADYSDLLVSGVTIHPAGQSPVLAPRIVAMWRARTIMKVTPWEGGTLFEAVESAIAGLDDPLKKAAAEEALERGSDFDRDGVFVPMLAQVVGITDEQMDDLMTQAAALPA